jgi:hypothetical protein
MCCKTEKTLIETGHLTARLLRSARKDGQKTFSTTCWLKNGFSFRNPRKTLLGSYELNSIQKGKNVYHEEHEAREVKINILILSFSTFS